MYLWYHIFMKKFIVFDFFGVVCSETLFIWLEKHNLPRKYMPALEITHKADLGLIRAEEEVAELAKLVGQTPEELEKEWREISTINRELVEEIRRLKEAGNYTALLSNAPSKYLTKLLEKEGIADAFSKIIISSNLGLAKPDPRIFEYALREIGAKAEEAVFIDDREKNVEGARAVGMTAFQFVSTEDFKNKIRAVVGD